MINILKFLFHVKKTSDISKVKQEVNIEKNEYESEPKKLFYADVILVFKNK